MGTIKESRIPYPTLPSRLPTPPVSLGGMSLNVTPLSAYLEDLMLILGERMIIHNICSPVADLEEKLMNRTAPASSLFAFVGVGEHVTAVAGCICRVRCRAGAEQLYIKNETQRAYIEIDVVQTWRYPRRLVRHGARVERTVAQSNVYACRRIMMSVQQLLRSRWHHAVHAVRDAAHCGPPARAPAPRLPRTPTRKRMRETIVNSAGTRRARAGCAHDGGEDATQLVAHVRGVAHAVVLLPRCDSDVHDVHDVHLRINLCLGMPKPAGSECIYQNPLTRRSASWDALCLMGTLNEVRDVFNVLGVVYFRTGAIAQAELRESDGHVLRPKCWTVVSVWVNPRVRRRRVATLGLSQVFNIARSMHVDQLIIDSGSELDLYMRSCCDSDALNFFHRMGFRCCAVSRNERALACHVPVLVTGEVNTFAATPDPAASEVDEAGDGDGDGDGGEGQGQGQGQGRGEGKEGPFGAAVPQESDALAAAASSYRLFKFLDMRSADMSVAHRNIMPEVKALMPADACGAARLAEMISNTASVAYSRM